MGSNDAETEIYILLLLADGNLPTGSFVASSGLESSATHGFFSSSSKSQPSSDALNHTTNFVRDSVASYARSAIPFVSDAHRIVENLAAIASAQKVDELTAERTIVDIRALDDLYEAMTLNHVAKRASRSQGVALLTLYTRGFLRPADCPPSADKVGEDREAVFIRFIERYKLLIRKEEMYGHLPICWGLLAAALGLSLGKSYGIVTTVHLNIFYTERSQYLHLFLHARSLLSASVRLNAIGPYASQQLLLHAVRPIVEAELLNSRLLRTGIRSQTGPTEQTPFNKTTDGPAITWPLAEILASRHDLQHSRIFNS
jgi:urease accessory protein